MNTITMKKIAAAVAFGLAVVPSFAQEKGCEKLKAEIAAGLDAKGVENYTLVIVAAEDVKDQKVVGSCDGGKKKIVYRKN
jgi:hypothetical protein